ncbi:type IV secretory system conjugative DNA transfer family protein [Mycobacterium sp. ZZG]
MTVIHKSPEDWRVIPNFVDYESTCADFGWDAAPDVCEGMGAGLCNIAYAAVDRHTGAPAQARTALRFVSEAGWDGGLSVRDLSYAELGTLTGKFTNVLRSLGVTKGGRVFTLLGRCPELYVTILGALRNGSVVSPLFSAFGPEPVATRLSIGEAEVLVTTKALYRKKIAGIRDTLPSLKHVFVIDDDVGVRLDRCDGVDHRHSHLGGRHHRQVDDRDGKGVARLLDGPIVSGARRWCPMRRWIDIGVFEDQTPARLPGSQGRIVVTGPPGSGKSHLIGLMAEQWILAGYGVLVVDPEGDHTELRDLDSVVLVDSRRHLLEPPDLVEMLHPRTSLVVDLSALNAAAKSGYIHRLRAVVEAHREQYGFPHWVIWDEAHLLGPQQEVRWVRRGGYVLSSFAPATLPADEVDASDVVVETLSPEGAEAAPWPVARAVIRHGGGRPRCFTVAGRRTSHIRHRHKYADVALPQERRFYFQPTDGQSPAPAATMREFGEAMIRLAPETLRFHLERGDFFRWLRHTIADAELAAEVASWEDELAAHHAAEAERIRTRISHAVQKRYLEAPG